MTETFSLFMVLCQQLFVGFFIFLSLQFVIRALKSFIYDRAN